MRNHFILVEIFDKVALMSKRLICPNCQRPQKTCLCDVIVCLPCDYTLLILQDPTEAKHALSTARLLASSIEGSRLLVGESFDPLSLLGASWRQECLLVYPGKNAISPEAVSPRQFKTIVLLDGTWRKVARLLHLNPWLYEIPCLAISADTASQYLIRKAPRADSLSTIEAATYALNVLHGNNNFDVILGAFHKMIALQIEAMGASTYAKNYKDRK
ncbi:MAG: DTW domain-containing protein YfiP [Zhongshania sp.]|jgi:DTW domain-containing protein YfiP